MIAYVTGDLLAALDHDAVLLHGVNVQGAFGAGFAAALKRVYPDCVPVYLQACAEKTFHPGGIVVYTPSPDRALPIVIHAATQEFFGRKGRARLPWVQTALMSSRIYLDEHNLQVVALPKIAAGLGGLDWKSQILPVVEETFGAWAGTATIYSLENES
jgi:O-acetyl-ADP-ribose deacetylase (regulator of RNase III)